MLYDIIGDLHGQADKLAGLLQQLNYEMKDGVYQHRGRRAVFVGDLIDRGRQNRRVISIVRGMVDGGHAHVVMGNHEYNAICYHTPVSETDWLRSHKASKFNQHKNFLHEYPLGQEETNEVIAWFKTLPLFLEFDDFRIIHACWDKEKISLAQKYLNEDNSLKEEYFAESAKVGSELFKIIERILKGAEVELPPPYSFVDTEGHERHNIRVKWWGEANASYRELAFGNNQDILASLPADQAPDAGGVPLYEEDDKPVFFGHYWMTGTPELQAANLCCVDYSAGKGQKLVGYAFDNPKAHRRLAVANFNCFY